jgi:CHRD domain-containing protein
VHVHLGKKGKAGRVIVPLCGPCKSGATGSAVVSTSIVNELKAGDAYVNVHTVKNAAGEIRGQIHG